MRLLALALFLVPAVALANKPPKGPSEKLTGNQQWVKAMAAGNDLIQRRNYIDAEKEFQNALKIANKMEHDDPKGAAKTCWSLGNVELTLGATEKAEALFGRSVGLEEKAQDLDEGILAEHFRALGNLYMQESKFAKAKKVYERAVEHAKTGQEELGRDPDWKDFAANQLALANATLKTGDPAAAEPLYEAARKSYAKTPGGVETDEDRRFIGRTMMGKADCLVAEKKTTDAGTLYEELVQRKVEGSCEAYAKFLKSQKRDADAKSLPCAKK